MNESTPSFKLKDEVPQPPSDWEISDLYSKAWKIVKQNKILWIFGAALAALEFGSGSSGNLGGSSGNTPSQDKVEQTNQVFNLLSPSSQSISKVLGDSTTNIEQIFLNLFKEIPLWMYLTIGIEVLFLISLFIFIRTVYKSWVEASLLTGTKIASDGEKPTIGSSSTNAFSSLKSLLWLDIIPGLLLTLVLIITITTVVIGMILGNLIVKIILGITSFIAIFVFIYSFIMLTMTLIWAKRKVVFDKTPAKTALLNGYQIAKKKYWATLLLGLVNGFLAGMIFILPIIVLVVLFVSGFTFGSSLNQSSVWITLSYLGGFAVLAFILGFTLLAGIITSFKATVWTLAYYKIKGKYDAS